jgi:hypothetical protein
VKSFISNINSGKNNGFYGKSHSKEHIQRLKSDNKGAKATSIPICQFSLDGKLIKTWPSLKGAARKLSRNKNEYESFCRKIRIRSSKNKWDSFLNSYWRLKSEYDCNGFEKFERPDKFPNNYIIIQKDKDGNIISKWKSLKDIERSLNVNYDKLWKSVKNFKFFNGFLWEKHFLN